MAEADKMFGGSIAGLYDEFMGPVFFEPFAKELARRVARLDPQSLLETAAGSGISTLALVKALPRTVIEAVDLNPAMIDVARAKPGLADVIWQAGDATKMPFADRMFDAVACQFGVMFYPDKLAAHREVLRVLKPAGSYVFNVWDSLEVNPLPNAVLRALARIFPVNSPDFMRRIPHGYFDIPEISRLLLEAGFRKVAAEQVKLPAQAPSAHHLAVALCQGTPLRTEIEALEPGSLNRVTQEVEKALVAEFGAGKIESTMQAIVFTASS